MSVSLKGDIELSTAMAKLGAQGSEICHDAAGGWAKGVTDSAQRRAPVLEGKLREDIHPEVEGTSASVVSDAVNQRGHSYASYVELGTGHGGAQPYLYPAFAEHRDVAPYVKEALARRGVL